MILSSNDDSNRDVINDPLSNERGEKQSCRILDLRAAIKHVVKSILHSQKAPDSANLTSKPPVIVESKWITHEINEKAFITFNQITGEYTYITEAPPIKNLVISGGGAKGVTLPGVFKSFEEHLPGEEALRDQLENIAGSSVGALQGSLLAGGIGADALAHAMEQEDFEAFLGKGLGPINKSGLPLLNFVRRNLRESIANHLEKIFPATALNELTHKEIANYLIKYTPCQEVEKITETLGKLVIELNKHNIDQSRITFSMLSALRQLEPKAFKNLIITATCCEKGETFYFDAENTPDLDIALAARASASLPVILERVYIPAEQLGIYAEEGKKGLTFVDGGYLDNIPVASVNAKQGTNPANQGELGQNLQTLALVFDSSDRKKMKQSPFLNASNKKHTLYDSSSLKERMIRDVFARRFGKIKTSLRNTKTNEEGLEVIRLEYSQRSIPLRLSLKGGDFKKAKQREKELVEQGLEEGREYLELHRREAFAKNFKGLEELLAYLPKEIKDSASFQSFREAIKKNDASPSKVD